MQNAWRDPHVDPGNYTNIEASIRYAQAAERGKFSFLFTPNFPAVRPDVGRSNVNNIIDPMMFLTAISQATSHIGFMVTGSTTFQEPFNHARQFKALDVLSHGVRAGTPSPQATRQLRRTMAVPSLSVRNAISELTSPSKLSRRCGEAGSRTPGSRTRPRVSLSPPPSCNQSTCKDSTSPHAAHSQYRPPSRDSRYLLSLAGRYASGFIAEVWTVEEGRAQREMVRRAAEEAGRDPDEIKYFAGIMPTVTTSVGTKRLWFTRDAVVRV